MVFWYSIRWRINDNQFQNKYVVSPLSIGIGRKRVPWLVVPARFVVAGRRRYRRDGEVLLWAFGGEEVLWIKASFVFWYVLTSFWGGTWKLVVCALDNFGNYPLSLINWKIDALYFYFNFFCKSIIQYMNVYSQIYVIIIFYF